MLEFFIEVHDRGGVLEDPTSGSEESSRTPQRVEVLEDVLKDSTLWFLILMDNGILDLKIFLGLD